MRRDEVEAAREQKRHMIVELRSLGSRYDTTGKPWAREDAERRDYLVMQGDVDGDELGLQPGHADPAAR